MADRYDYVFYIHKSTFYSGLVGGGGRYSSHKML